MGEINNKQVYNVKDWNVAMQVYNLIEYSKKYSKNSGNLWQHCRDEPAEDDFGNNVSFVAINTISSF